MIVHDLQYKCRFVVNTFSKLMLCKLYDNFYFSIIIIIYYYNFVFSYLFILNFYTLLFFLFLKKIYRHPLNIKKLCLGHILAAKVYKAR